MIELMISIAVGLVVVSGVIGMFVSTVTSNANNLKMTRLNQELRAVMDVMVQDIRRAGYRGDSITAVGANPFVTGLNDLTVTGTDCITFTYDSTALDNPTAVAGWGLVDAASDAFGYRRDVVGGVGVVRSGTGGAVTLGNCTTGDWQDLTDSDSVDITQLQFGVLPTIAGVGGAQLTTRVVTISLTGQLRNSNPPVRRTISETVKVVNS